MVAAEAGARESAEELRQQGNAAYRDKQYLRAAAIYSQAIKIDANDAVLYSNRCVALLRLKKVTKALADAEKACELRPDWEKAHFRRGLALEELERHEEALAAYIRADELESNGEIKEKIKNLKALVRKAVSAPARPHAIRNVEEYRSAQEQAMDKATEGTVQPVELSHDRVMAFAKDVLGGTLESLRRGEGVEPAVVFLPGWRTQEGEEPRGHVALKSTFDSPDTLAECVDFLRKYTVDYRAHAAVLVVMRSEVAYPQTWKQNGWVHGNMRGCFVQLDSQLARRMWFIPLPKGKPAENPIELEDEEKWRMLPRLFS